MSSLPPPAPFGEPIPQALPYETPSSTDGSLWSALRIILIAWAALVICRHGIYWIGTIASLQGFGGGLAGRNVASFVFAMIDVVLLILIVASVAMLRPLRRGRLMLLCGLCVGFIAAGLLGFVVEQAVYYSTVPTMSTWPSMLWRFVSRLQGFVVPAMPIAVLLRWKPV